MGQKQIVLKYISDTDVLHLDFIGEGECPSGLQQA